MRITFSKKTKNRWPGFPCFFSDMPRGGEAAMPAVFRLQMDLQAEPALSYQVSEWGSSGKVVRTREGR